MSFNEMYHVDIDEASGGWGIDVATLPHDLTMLVKQLRKPVTKEVLSNIRKAEKAPCFFMFLGSCSN